MQETRQHWKGAARARLRATAVRRPARGRFVRLAGCLSLLAVVAGAGVAGTAAAGASAPVVPVAVSAGGQHSCALTSDQTVVCWGWDAFSQVSGMPAGARFASVDTGTAVTCGVKTDQSLACWGYDSYRQVRDVPAGTGFASVDAAGFHACAVKVDAAAVCWGSNFQGQATVPDGLMFRSVATGVFNTCGITTDGGVACWGNDGGRVVSDVPAGTTFRSVSVGDFFGCALDVDDRVTCWGQDDSGLVSGAPPEARSVDAGDHFACGVKADGGLACWGGDNYGVVSGAPAGTDFVSVSAGADHACALRTDATVTCWGETKYGKTAVPATLSPVTDTAAPTTSIGLSPASPTGQNGWYTAPVGVSITAQDGDGSGVAATRCALDPATAPTIFEDLPAQACSLTTLGQDGQHDIYAASIDVAGNRETPVTSRVKIDATPPDVLPTLSAATVFLNQTGVTAAANATDATSGVATSGCGAIDTTTAGDHTVTCTATDNAGNQSSATVHYTVQYKALGFFSPAPGSKWKAGQNVPIKIALADVNGTRISDAQAAALASSCRVTFTATGVQNLRSQCMKYDAVNDQFIYNWMLAKSPTGTVTLTVAVSYTATTTTTTISQPITITK